MYVSKGTFSFAWNWGINNKTGPYTILSNKSILQTIENNHTVSLTFFQ